ncbi:MAG: hypothetical protein FJ288_13845 [Planctomycetes bacterium]|nr:hypothetical protein [Planctomycetota bacterium]
MARGSASCRCRGASPLCGIVHLFGRPSRALHVSRCRSGFCRLRRLAGLGGAYFGLICFLFREVRGLGRLVRKFAQLGDRQRGRHVLRRRFAGCFGSLGRLFRAFSRCLGPLHDTANGLVVSNPRFLSRPGGIACRPRCRFGLRCRSRRRLACSHCRAACLLRRLHSALGIPGYRSVIRRLGSLARLSGTGLSLPSLPIRRSGCLSGL